MIQILKLPDTQFNMLKAKMEKVGNMQEQVVNTGKEMEKSISFKRKC